MRSPASQAARRGRLLLRAVSYFKFTDRPVADALRRDLNGFRPGPDDERHLLYASSFLERMIVTRHGEGRACDIERAMLKQVERAVERVREDNAG